MSLLGYSSTQRKFEVFKILKDMEAEVDTDTYIRQFI